LVERQKKNWIRPAYPDRNTSWKRAHSMHLGEKASGEDLVRRKSVVGKEELLRQNVNSQKQKGSLKGEKGGRNGDQR